MTISAATEKRLCFIYPLARKRVGIAWVWELAGGGAGLGRMDAEVDRGGPMMARRSTGKRRSCTGMFEDFCVLMDHLFGRL